IWRIESNVYVHGYRSKIHKLILILLDNALKYSDDHGKIAIIVDKKGGKAIVHVYNTGKGIGTDDQQKIFQRFYRGDKSHSDEVQGHGLGLSIAFEIATLHKTIIHVKSEEGKWADFSFSLDLA
ncbi:MAG: ATP-binding protein, partial [Spirochaetaceae bacterium]|nr:ATP-binding protein [Spirochaetaceae bacterium]